jgi:hypothetical protein
MYQLCPGNFNVAKFDVLSLTVKSVFLKHSFVASYD